MIPVDRDQAVALSDRGLQTTGDDTEQHRRRRSERRIRRKRFERHARATAPSGHVHGDRAAALRHRAQQEAPGRRGSAPRERREPRAQPVGLDLVTGERRDQEARAPARELRQCGPERESRLGQLVDGDAGRGIEAAPTDQAALLEAREALREHARRHIAEPSPQRAEALRPEQELAQHEQRPPFAEQLGGASQRAELRIAEGGHVVSLAGLVLN